MEIRYIKQDGQIYLHGNNLVDELIAYNAIFADDAGFTKDTLIHLIDWIIQEIESDNATV